MAYNYFYSILIVFCILLFIFIKNYKNKNRMYLLILLYIYHIFFAYIYYKMSLSNNADSIQYYFDVLNNLKNYDFHFSYGTYFIKNITYILIKYLHFSYWNTTLLFASFAFFGFYILFNLVNWKQMPLSKYLVLMFFLPNIHFWSVGIGKDSFIFFSLVLLVYSIYGKNIILIGLSLFLVFLVRPHIAFLILLSFAFSALFFSKMKIYYKITIVMIIGLVIVSTINLLLQYIGLNDINPTAVGDYIEQRQSYNTQGGSSINIKEYNFFMKIFSFLYRPLFESSNILSLVVSIENTIYLLLTIMLFKYRKFIDWSQTNVLGIIFIIIFTILLSNMTANLGIAVRQKTMLIPMFFLLIASAHQNRRSSRYAK